MAGNSETPENSKQLGKRKRTLPKEAEPFKFKPGQSGNPGGRPKKKPITEIYEEILADPSNCKKIREIVIGMLQSGKMAAQLQLKEMAERVEGRVTQPVEVDGEIRISLAQAIAKARERIK